MCIRDRFEMDRKWIFTTPEEVLEELRCQEEESESEQEFEENVSEPDDEILQPENVLTEDLFDAEECADDDCLTVSNSTFCEDVNFLLGKDNETIWADNPINSKFCRTRNTNIITHLPGPKGEARSVTDENKLFSLFINDIILEKIVLHKMCIRDSCFHHWL